MPKSQRLGGSLQSDSEMLQKPNYGNGLTNSTVSAETFSVNSDWGSHGLLVQRSVISGGVYNNTKITHNTTIMSHKHHPKEARIRAVQQQDGGRPTSEICKEMNVAPSTLKRWRDQLHLLAPSDAALIREQDKMIEHMARIVADQAVRLRIMEIALQKKR